VNAILAGRFIPPFIHHPKAVPQGRLFCFQDKDMAGYAPISLQQRCGIDGKPYAGAKAYFYEASTLTALTTYQDYGLGAPHPQPVVANAFGVFPAIFLDEADEFYRLRITTSGGVILDDLVTLPIIGPSGGGGGSEVPVDANSLIKTGDFNWQPITGSRAGFVRLNGRSIGSALSGATERANADVESLFLHNWNTYSNDIFPVTGGRGSSASDDWAAAKTMTLFDAAGLMAAGLDNMGNGAKSIITSSVITTGDGSTALSTGGADRHTLTKNEMPVHDHELTDDGHAHGYDRYFTSASASAQSSEITGLLRNVAETDTETVTTGITMSNAGGGAAHNNMPPFMLGTWYQKLVVPLGFLALSILQSGGVA
jgi:microcystin-dependent protein